MKKFTLLLLAGIVMFGCSNPDNQKKNVANDDQKKIEITNDMENAMAVIPSWINEKTVMKLTEPNAHSGQFAAVTNDTIEYSYGFQELLKNLNQGVPKHVVLTGWVYSTVEKPNISIVLDLSENLQSFAWKPFPLTDKVTEAGKWIEFTADFYFDQPLKPEHQLKIYAWNQSKKQVYLDDFKLTFEY